MTSYMTLYFKLYDAVADALVEFNRGNDANMVCILETAMQECDAGRDRLDENRLKRMSKSKKQAD